MKPKIILMFMAGLLLLAARGYADEYGMGEYGREEPNAMVAPKPSENDMREAVTNYLNDAMQANGYLEVSDPRAEQARRLKLSGIHPDVVKAGADYIVSAMFKDSDSGEILELEFEVQDNNGEPVIASTSIRSVDGKERYTYDDNYNRVSVKQEKEEPKPEEQAPQQEEEAPAGS
jgi:hypothetical protein